MHAVCHSAPLVTAQVKDSERQALKSCYAETAPLVHRRNIAEHTELFDSVCLCVRVLEFTTYTKPELKVTKLCTESWPGGLSTSRSL